MKEIKIEVERIGYGFTMTINGHAVKRGSRFTDDQREKIIMELKDRKEYYQHKAWGCSYKETEKEERYRRSKCFWGEVESWFSRHTIENEKMTEMCKAGHKIYTFR